MKKISRGPHPLSTARRDRGVRSPSRGRQRGVSSLMFLFLLIPLLLAVGIAVDFARMVQFRSDLQNAVDEAALAGATVYTNSSQSALATTVATNYFNRAILPYSSTVTLQTPVPNPSGTINPALGNAPALTVTVTATATVPTTLMSLVAPSTVTIQATATAANPEVTPQLTVPVTLSNACDGNIAYVYEVPANSSKTGYDYSYTALSKLSSSAFYELYTSYPAGSTLGQLPALSMPTFSVNQPLGVMLRNDTNGNASGNGSNVNCGTAITGANSYGAPNGASQYFYSSLLMNGQSPSANTNNDYTYTATVTTQTKNGTKSVTSATLKLTAANGTPTTLRTPTLSSSWSYTEQMATLLGDASCSPANPATTSTSSRYSSGSSSSTTSTTTTYTCNTQYPTTTNCSLEVQTGLTSSQLSALKTSATAPYTKKCFDMTPTDAVEDGTAYSAPSCAQLSALASGSSSSGSSSSPAAPVAVFWWDDAGGEGPLESSFGPASHCAGMTSSDPGYGEDCQYGNMVVALQCNATGGSGTGYTSVVLTQ